MSEPIKTHLRHHRAKFRHVCGLREVAPADYFELWVSDAAMVDLSGGLRGPLFSMPLENLANSGLRHVGRLVDLCPDCVVGIQKILEENAEADKIRKQLDQDGLVGDQPVDLDGGGQIPIPPLLRPELEVLMETIDLAGRLAYRVSLAGNEVQIGGVTVKIAPDMKALGNTREEALVKLSRMVGAAIGQAYLDLKISDDDEQHEAARSMEIG